jgi:hypothetical protein
MMILMLVWYFSHYTVAVVSFMVDEQSVGDTAWRGTEAKQCGF